MLLIKRKDDVIHVVGTEGEVASPSIIVEFKRMT